MRFLYIVAAILFVLLAKSIQIVPEGQQALVREFSAVKGDAITKAGLYFKIPFIQDFVMLDKRVLNWDGDPEQIPTKDKRYIWVDSTARWRIFDPKTFYVRLKTNSSARAKIDSVLDGATRDVVGSYNLVETVRNSNTILETVKERELNKDVTNEVEEVTGEIASIAIGREKLSQLIYTKGHPKLKALGIELIDVQLRGVAYEKSVEQKVFKRMISERKRVAEKIRSFGLGESQKIQGKLNLDLRDIESTAYRTVQEIKGKSEAEAIKIYAEALKQDPDFYEFTKSLEVLKNSLKTDGAMYLSTDSEALKALKKSP